MTRVTTMSTTVLWATPPVTDGFIPADETTSLFLSMLGPPNVDIPLRETSFPPPSVLQRTLLVLLLVLGEPELTPQPAET